MPGFPDWQRITQWIGDAFTSQNDLAIGAGQQTFGPFTVRSWASVIVACKPTGATATITVRMGHADAPAGLEVDQTLVCAVGVVTEQAYGVIGDEVTIIVQGGGAGSTVDLVVFPANSVQETTTITAGVAERVNSLPASPTDGQEVVYVADGSTDVEWHLKYVAASGRWRKIGGPPLTAEVQTDEATTSTSYADLATAGPTVTAPLAGDYLVRWAANMRGNAGTSHVAVKIGAAAAADADSSNVGGADRKEGTNWRRKTLAASDAVKLQYRTGGSGTSNFERRRVSIDPFYVS